MHNETTTGNPANNPLELLDKQDMLQLLHISARTLQTWRDNNLIAFVQLRGKIYYLRTDVEAMIRDNRVEVKVKKRGKGK
jgi:hypothetical protein